MKATIKSILLLSVVLLFDPTEAYPQVLRNVAIANSFGLAADQIVLSDSSSVIMARSRPLFSFRMNGRLFNSTMVNVEKENEKYSQSYENGLRVTFQMTDSSAGGWNGNIVFENISDDTLSISNVVPFGEDSNSVFITGDGRNGACPCKVVPPGLQTGKGHSA